MTFVSFGRLEVGTTWVGYLGNTDCIHTNMSAGWGDLFADHFKADNLVFDVRNEKDDNILYGGREP